RVGRLPFPRGQGGGGARVRGAGLERRGSRRASRVRARAAGGPAPHPPAAGVPRRGDGPPRTGAPGGILEPNGPARNRPRACRAARSPPRYRIGARPRAARGRSLGTADAGPGYRPLRRSSGARARARDPAPRASEPALLAARADGARRRARLPMADETRSVTTHDLLAMKERGERIVVLTCYDALFARLLDAAGVDLLL